MLWREIEKNEEIDQADDDVDDQKHFFMHVEEGRVRPSNESIGEVTPNQKARYAQIVTRTNQPVEPTEHNEHSVAQKLLGIAAKRPHDQAPNHQRAQILKEQWGSEQTIKLKMLQVFRMKLEGFSCEGRDVQERRIGYYQCDVDNYWDKD